MDLNYKELNKEWEEDFYEGGWEPNTLKYTETENNIVDELKAFLPRHMPEYDWNLPYAEAILLIFRRHTKPLEIVKGERKCNPKEEMKTLKPCGMIKQRFHSRVKESDMRQIST